MREFECSFLVDQVVVEQEANMALHRHIWEEVRGNGVELLEKKLT